MEEKIMVKKIILSTISLMLALIVTFSTFVTIFTATCATVYIFVVIFTVGKLVVLRSCGIIAKIFFIVTSIFCVVLC